MNKYQEFFSNRYEESVCDLLNLINVDHKTLELYKAEMGLQMSALFSDMYKLTFSSAEVDWEPYQFRLRSMSDGSVISKLSVLNGEDLKKKFLALAQPDDCLFRVDEEGHLDRYGIQLDFLGQVKNSFSRLATDHVRDDYMELLITAKELMGDDYDLVSFSGQLDMFLNVCEGQVRENYKKISEVMFKKRQAINDLSSSPQYAAFSFSEDGYSLKYGLQRPHYKPALVFPSPLELRYSLESSAFKVMAYDFGLDVYEKEKFSELLEQHRQSIHCLQDPSVAKKLYKELTAKAQSMEPEALAQVECVSSVELVETQECPERLRQEILGRGVPYRILKRADNRVKNDSAVIDRCRSAYIAGEIRSVVSSMDLNNNLHHSVCIALLNSEMGVGKILEYMTGQDVKNWDNRLVDKQNLAREVIGDLIKGNRLGTEFSLNAQPLVKAISQSPLIGIAVYGSKAQIQLIHDFCSADNVASLGVAFSQKLVRRVNEMYGSVMLNAERCLGEKKQALVIS